MDTWLVFITARTLRGQTPNRETADGLQDELISQAGRTGEPGIDPEVTITDSGAIRIRQTFPMVSAFLAVRLASESLRRPMKPEEADNIKAVRLADWLADA